MAEIDLRVRKWDVVDELRRRIGARSYAQVVSASTSYDMLQRPELNEFGTVTGFMYASDFQRLERPEVGHLPTLDDVEALVRRSRVMADIVFADPWHSYDHSIRVLQLAYEMVAPGGYLVVHDCNPDQAEYTVAEPDSCDMCWCGETWRAFVDLTASLPDSAEWWVLASDLGVGVVRSAPDRPRFRTWGRRRITRTVPDTTFDEKWRWLDDRRADVLRLVSVEEWHERTRGPDLVDRCGSE